MTVPWPAGFLEGLVEGLVEGGRPDPPEGFVPVLVPDIEVFDEVASSSGPLEPLIEAAGGDAVDSKVEPEHPVKPITNNKTTPIDLVVDL